MTFPFKDKYTNGYGFWVKTYYSPHHLGKDYHFNFNAPVVAHLDSWIAKTGWDSQIGNYLVLKDSNGKYIRHCHLKRIDVGIGSVSEGQQLGLVGNTGSMNGVTYAIHDHIDIWHAYPNVTLVKQTWNKDLLIDPEIYFKNNEEDNMPLQIKERYTSPNKSQFAHLANGEEINKTVGGDSPIYDLFRDYVIDQNNDQWLLIRDGKAKVVLTSDLIPKKAPFVPQSALEAAEGQIVAIAGELGVTTDKEAIINAIKDLKKTPEKPDPEPEPSPTPEPPPNPTSSGWQKFVKKILDWIKNKWNKIFNKK